MNHTLTAPLPPHPPHVLDFILSSISLQASKHDGFHSDLSKKGNEISALLAKAKASTPANAALIEKISAAAEEFDGVKKDSGKRQDQLKKCLGDAQVSLSLSTFIFIFASIIVRLSILSCLPVSQSFCCSVLLSLSPYVS